MKGTNWPFTLKGKVFTSDDELEEAVYSGDPDKLVESKVQAVVDLLRAQGIEIELATIEFYNQEVTK